MSLIDRLAGFPEDPGNPEVLDKIAVGYFWAMLVELSQDQKTKNDIANAFSLTTDEQTELDWVISRYNAQPNAAAKEKFIELMQVIFLLAEVGESGYTTRSELQARINAI